MRSVIAGKLGDRRFIRRFLLASLIVVEIFYGSLVAILVGNLYLTFAVIGIIVAVVAFIEPVWGLYAFVAAMFAEGLLAVEAGPTGAKLLGILVFGAWVARSMSSGRFQINLPLPGIFAIAYVVWGLMSMSWAVDIQLAFDQALVVVQSVVLYVLVINLVNSPRRMQNILSVIVVVSVATAFLTIVHVLSGETIEGRADMAQISGYDPNDQAAIFLLGAAVLMVMFSREVRLSRKLLLLFALSIIMLAILATSSRGSIVSLSVALAFALILDRRAGQLVLLALLIGGVASFLLPPTFLARVESIATLSDRGAGRIDIWLVGLRIVGAHPLLGVGWGNFGRAFDRYMPETPDLAFTISRGRGPHNILLGALGELGAIGFALFAATLGVTIKSALTAVLNFKRKNDFCMTSLAMGVFLGLLGVLVAGLFVDLRIRKYFWLLLSLAEMMRHLAAAPEGGGSERYPKRGSE
jgi:hypothetical protein